MDEWTEYFERFWTEQLSGIKQAAELKARQLANLSRPASNNHFPEKEKHHDH